MSDPLPIPAELAVEAEPFDDETLDLALAGATTVTQLDDGVPGETTYVRAEVERWSVTDDGSAEWALRRLAEARQQVATLTRQAEEWRARIDAWHARMLGPLERRVEFFEGHLKRYALDRRLDDPRAKSLILPSGRIQTREAKPRVVVADPDAWQDWAEGNPADPSVRHSFEVAKRELAQVTAWSERAVDDGAGGQRVELVVTHKVTGERLRWADVEPGRYTASVELSRLAR